MHIISTFVIGSWMLFANGCDGFVVTPQKKDTLSSQREKLIVLAPEHELSFSRKVGFQNEVVQSGIDLDLVQGFADFAGYDLSILSFNTREQALQSFSQGEGDLLIDRWPSNRTVPGSVDGPTFENSKLALYCPKSLHVFRAAELINIKIFMRTIDSKAYQQLKPPLYPQIEVHEVKTEDAKILPLTLSQNPGCAIMEERLGDYEKAFYSQIEKVYTFPFDLGLTWKIREGKTELFRSLRQWFQLASRKDLIVPVISRYTSSVTSLSPEDMLAFDKYAKLRMSNYLETFRFAAKQARVPWRMLAAVGYQESHLDNEAVSFTGVQGIMQITQSTAVFLELEDRLNPHQSIPAAAKYLGWLFAQWPKNIPYMERVKLTLACYNMGYQHIRDVQEWLIKKNQNPYSWKDLKQGLERKADPERASEFILGTARGQETIQFVERVLAFENLFRRTHPQKHRH